MGALYPIGNIGGGRGVAASPTAAAASFPFNPFAADADADAGALDTLPAAVGRGADFDEFPALPDLTTLRGRGIAPSYPLTLISLLLDVLFLLLLAVLAVPGFRYLADPFPSK